MTTPTLICCSHGTDSTAGREVITAIVGAAESLLGVPTVQTYVDVQYPQVDEVVAGVDGPAVIVPLLLSPGFHTSVDIGRAAATRPDVVATATLGPHPALVDILVERIVAAGAGPRDHVILAAAGSSRPEAARSVERVRDAVSARIACPIGVGYAYGARPRVDEAVDRARDAGAERVIVAQYVLAPGHFSSLVSAAGGDVNTEPVGTDPRLASVVAERYRQGCLDLGAQRVARAG